MQDEKEVHCDNKDLTGSNCRTTLYYQVSNAYGNGTTILADDDFWRPPQADDRLNAHPGAPDYYVEYRPVFRAGPPGSPISPNLAGRLAADFGLCYQLYVEPADDYTTLTIPLFAAQVAQH